jgi:phage gpG-like protein
MADDVNFSTKGLDQILKALKGKQPYARIGVLGTSAGRGGGTSNAQIAAAHEYGTSSLPVRSFLRMPLTENLDKRLAGSGAFNKDLLSRLVKEGNFISWVEKLAILSEAIVGEAFDSGGFGKWSALNPKTMAAKKVKQILLETGQLRNSITSEVVA